jgi:nitroreductase
LDLIEGIRMRRSCRAFQDQPISRELLIQVLKDASNAPSAINIQPWEVTIVCDEERKRLSKKLIRAFRERGTGCSPGASRALPDAGIRRARESADAMTPLIQEMGCDFRTYVNEGSLNFYGAPAVALLFIDESFPADRVTDLGSFMAYLVLAAAGHGLASCPIGLVKAYEDEVKDALNVPESKVLVISVALGKPDLEAAINQFKSPRMELQDFVRWVV